MVGLQRHGKCKRALTCLRIEVFAAWKTKGKSYLVLQTFKQLIALTLLF